MTIYRDVLGIPQPIASIIHFGGSWGRGGYWAVASTADLPIQGAHYDSPEAAEAAAIADGWVVTNRDVDGYGAARLTISHPETAAALEAAHAATDARWSKATPCYVRYGKLPRGGRSRNHATGDLECGVSVFRGEVLPSGKARALPGTHVLAASMVSLRDRDLYVVDGVEIGVGSDGEPVLKNCKIVSKSTK